MSNRKLPPHRLEPKVPGRARSGKLAGMDAPLTLHIVDANSRSRAEQARVAFELGHHAEVYSDLEELFARAPRGGIIIVHQTFLEQGLRALMDRMADRGIWLPIIASAVDPHTDAVVQAIKEGALHYVRLPLDGMRLARCLEQVLREATAHTDARRKLIEARRRVERLSKREREVLDWLSQGLSNKNIARQLGISSRTVEIHRANMMEKLQASHSADAVRLRLETELDDLTELAQRRRAH